MSAPVPTQEIRSLLRVEGLRVELENGDDIVSDIHLRIAAGEIVGLVGESGSGKSTISAALVGHVRAGARVAEGRVLIDEEVDLLRLAPNDLRRVRGAVVGYVSQDPATALNPLLRIGSQLAELMEVHAPELDRKARGHRAESVLADVGLPSDTEFLRRFPHQLSGGQQQRIVLALAFALRPRLIVLDEPTTALDVTTQAKILETIRKLCTEYGTAALYVSHDLAVVRELVDRVVVLYAGRIAEAAPSAALFAAPAHPYTRGLLDAIPNATRADAVRPIAGRAATPGNRPKGCAFGPRCSRWTLRCSRIVPVLGTRHDARREVACFHPLSPNDGPASEATRSTPDAAEPQTSQREPLLSVHHLSAAYGPNPVLSDIEFELLPGECLALVGESGSGKTTLARALAGLGAVASGEVTFAGAPLSLSSAERSPETRRRIQYVFQNPHRAFNPTKTIGRTLSDVVEHFFAERAEVAGERVARALERVALPRTIVDGYPRELSGGELQRVAIARALVCEPELLICDEITSSLDVSVQATILKLLSRLQARGLSLLFVTHDLGVVRTLADRVLVLARGQIVESGSVQGVLDWPTDPYTRELVANSPGVRT